MSNRLTTLLVRNLMKPLRLGTYLGVVTVGVSLVGARVVHAKTATAALAIGEPLGRIELSDDASNTLSFNGQRLHVTASHVDADVRAVLDRTQKACESHADGLADDLGNIDQRFATAPPSTRGFPGIAILRDEREGRGVVVCFATGKSTTMTDVAHRLARFSRTEVLSDLGDLRYVAVHAEGSGARIVATWSDERLALGEMFPKEGDAPGGDPHHAPRPSNAQRLMTVRVEPAPYGAFMYATSAAASVALADYDTALRESGFTAVPPTDPGSRAYQRGLVDVLVTTQPTSDGRTMLSVVESSYASAHAGGTR